MERPTSEAGGWLGGEGGGKGETVERERRWEWGGPLAAATGCCLHVETRWNYRLEEGGGASAIYIAVHTEREKTIITKTNKNGACGKTWCR